MAHRAHRLPLCRKAQAPASRRRGRDPVAEGPVRGSPDRASPGRNGLSAVAISASSLLRGDQPSMRCASTLVACSYFPSSGTICRTAGSRNAASLASERGNCRVASRGQGSGDQPAGGRFDARGVSTASSTATSNNAGTSPRRCPWFMALVAAWYAMIPACTRLDQTVN
jgi:hypothetical protein